MSASYPPVRNFSAFSTRSGVFTSPSRSGFSPSSMSSCLTRSCTLVFYIALFALPLAGALPDSSLLLAQETGATAPQDDPDALYRERSDLAKAKKAATIWAARLAANARDFE